MLVWMRLSTQKQLPWYKGSNYQSKDVAHIQKTLAQRMGDKASTSHPILLAVGIAVLQVLRHTSMYGGKAQIQTHDSSKIWRVHSLWLKVTPQSVVPPWLSRFLWHPLGRPAATL